MAFPTSGLIAYYNFNETSGTAAADSVGSNNLKSDNPNFVTGYIGEGRNYVVDSNHYYNISGQQSAFSFDQFTPYSFSFWMKRNGTGADAGTLISKFDNAIFRGYEIFLGYNPDYLYARLSNSGSGANYIEVRSNIEISDTNWHNVVWTYDGSNNASGMKIYIDGVDRSYIVISNLSATAVNAAWLHVGDSTTPNQPNSIIDEIGIWNRALTAQEADDVYTGGSPYPPPPSYTLSSYSHNFGTHNEGATEPFIDVTITNTGGSPLNFTFINSTNFYFNVGSVNIPTGNNYIVRIYAKTNSGGSHNENVGFNESILGLVNYNCQSSIIAIPVYSYTTTPTSLNFGILTINDTEPSQTVSILNTGNETLNFTFIDSTNFYFTINNHTLLPSQGATLTVKAKTNVLGIHNEIINITEPNAGNTNVSCLSDLQLAPTTGFYSDNQYPVFPSVEIGSSGFILGSDQLISIDSLNSLSITWTNSTHFQINATSPILLPNSGDSANYNIENFAPFNSIGSFQETIIFDDGIGTTYNIFPSIDVIIFPPNTLDGVSYFEEGFLNWIDGSVTGVVDGFIIERKIGTGSWTQIGTSLVNNFDDQTAVLGVTYTYRVAAYIGGDQSAWSNEFQLLITNNEVPPYCDEFNYVVTNESSCGFNDGSISITLYSIYLSFYTFSLKDINGNQYLFDNNGLADNLSPNYYFLEVSPITNKFRDSCKAEFIHLLSTNSSINIINENLSPAICGSFNIQFGRAVFTLDFNTGYEYSLYDSTGKLIKTEITISDLIIQDLSAGIYYLYLKDSTTQCTILHQFKILEDTSGLSVPNIQEIYITQWSDNFDLTYWSTANDPDYYGGLDTTKFQSTKIASYATGLTWYSIIVDEQNVNFSQALSKVRQGFIFDDVLTIGIPFNDTNKWNALKTLIEDRWVVVFKDANDNWWTFGYKHGAKAEDYTFGSELGGFTLGLKAVSENKIITAIDESWVINNIK